MNKAPNYDVQELEKFANLAMHWWDENGDLKTLHQLNPLRLGYIKEKINLQNRHVLDVGCGGGILSESLASEGAKVTAIDMNPKLIEDTLSPTVMRINEVTSLRETQFPEDAGPLAHPVRPDSYIEINNFYTATIYNKGAEVLRMLQTILGKNLFRKGMDLYFARHDGQAVTIEDYIKTMEDVSGIDLAQFRLWYSQAGTPMLTVADDYDASQKIYTLTINQTCPLTPFQPEKKPMLIPIRMSLLDQAGKEMPLILNHEKVETEKVLQLTQSSQIFQFKNVPERPVPSLLRYFSAPVILNYPYADVDLLFLFKYDTDPFNRYEAGQKYALKVILDLIRDYRQQNPLNVPHELIGTISYLLEHPIDDSLLLADLLTLPSEKYIAEQMSVIDVTAIHAVREWVLADIAKQLQAHFLRLYQENQTKGPYQFNMESIGKRQLKNRCLQYLALLPNNAALVMKQFEESLQTNMSDTQAALVALSNIDSPLREQALDQFYAAWKQDALVVDKWLAIQAATKLPTALLQVKKLMRHPAFELKNPNKVYALIGTFGHRNQSHFHTESGEGYAFLRDTVQQLDKINPQIAARMVKPLTMLKRYDKERQELMREQLALLLENNKISPDLYEIVSKSLEN